MADPLINTKTFPVLCGLLADRPTRLSRAMHSAGYHSLGLPFEYINFDTVDTAGALTAMRVLGIRGLSLTIPHKEAALPLLDLLSEDVREIGAVNTVVNRDGALEGHNTDWIGIREALTEAAFAASGKSVLILGSGGAARAAITALQRMSAGRIVITNRTSSRGIELARETGTEFLTSTALDDQSARGFDLIINSTPVGSKLAGSDQSFRFNPAALQPKQCVFDFVTTPTDLIAGAASAGAKTVAGSRMLLFQALAQFNLFTGREAPREAMEAALAAELARMAGMSGEAGK